MLKLSSLFEYLDAQVNLTTVLLAVAAALLVWFVVKRAVSLVLAAVRRIDAVALFCIMSGVLAPGTLAYGISQAVNCPRAVGVESMDDDKLLAALKDKDASPEKIKLVLDYKKEQPQSVSTPEMRNGSPTIAGWCIGGGLGLIAVCIIVACKHFD